MIQPAIPEDYNELLAFENSVFDVQFLKKVPKLYANAAFCVACHGVIREEERIVGAVAAYPTALTTLGGTLNAIGIGSVAVDARSRGKGYMKDMMAFCDEKAKQHGAVIGFLSGYRQRYERYGFTPAGTRVLFEVSDYFIAHRTPGTEHRFETLKKCPDAVPELARLFNTQAYRWRREEGDFALIVACWEEQCFRIRDGSGRVCGYLIAEKTERDVSELLLNSDADAADVLVAYAKAKKLQTLRVAVHEGQNDLKRMLASFCEHPQVHAPADFKVYDFSRFISVLGTHRAKTASLVEGSVVLRIGNETLRVTVQDRACSVQQTGDAPEVTLTPTQATAVLTMRLGALCDHPLLNAWAPLCPLSLPHSDGV